MAERDAKGKELRPAISVGKLWITWLNDNHPELAHRYKDYMHLLPNGIHRGTTTLKRQIIKSIEMLCYEKSKAYEN